jgi:hypothetical protein
MLIINIKTINKKVIGMLIAFMAVCIMIAMSTTGCGKKKKLTYGDTEGVVSGNITFDEDGATFNLDNVIASAGTDIDYTSGIITSGETEDYSLEVNASNVKYDKVGTYTASYTVKSGDNTYTDSIKVTITDENIDNDGDNNRSYEGENGAVQSDEGKSEAVQNGSSQNDGSSQNNSSQSTASQNGNSQNSGTQNNAGQNENNSQRVLITGESITYKNKNIPNAVIELLSGDVVTISCSTDKYIVSTRTDESQVTKSGHNYKVTKLIVTFNTGKEQTLETIEKRMD